MAAFSSDVQRNSGIPWVLICPADASRMRATNFTFLNNSNISFLWDWTPHINSPQDICIRRPQHHQRHTHSQRHPAIVAEPVRSLERRDAQQSRQSSVVRWQRAAGVGKTGLRNAVVDSACLYEPPANANTRPVKLMKTFFLPKRHRGITLLEILVVLVVLSMLAAVLLAAILRPGSSATLHRESNAPII